MKIDLNAFTKQITASMGTLRDNDALPVPCGVIVFYERRVRCNTMMISSKGRYALHVLIDIARQPEGVYVPLKDVATRQGMSVKYLEAIVATLTRGGFLESLRGKSGGYRLNRKPNEYSIGAILRTAEGGIAPVSCIEDGVSSCAQADCCPTFPLWQKLDNLIHDYLEQVTLQDLMDHTLDNETEGILTE